MYIVRTSLGIHYVQNASTFKYVHRTYIIHLLCTEGIMCTVSHWIRTKFYDLDFLKSVQNELSKGIMKYENK